jgi:hypothetical protein
MNTHNTAAAAQQQPAAGSYLLVYISSRKILTGKYPGKFSYENSYLNIFEKIVSGKYYQKIFP